MQWAQLVLMIGKGVADKTLMRSISWHMAFCLDLAREREFQLECWDSRRKAVIWQRDLRRPGTDKCGRLSLSAKWKISILAAGKPVQMKKILRWRKSRIIISDDSLPRRAKRDIAAQIAT